MPVATVEHLLSRYGSLAGEVLELVRADRSLGRPLFAAASCEALQSPADLPEPAAPVPVPA